MRLAIFVLGIMVGYGIFLFTVPDQPSDQRSPAIIATRLDPVPTSDRGMVGPPGPDGNLPKNVKRVYIENLDDLRPSVYGRTYDYSYRHYPAYQYSPTYRYPYALF